MAEDAIPRHKLVALPYGIPAVKVWVPGKDYAARQLGVVRYMVRPVTHQALLSAIEEVGAEVQTVLLVDDQAEVLQLFARMLSSASRRYRILQAMDGQRALSLLRERKPDLVLLDMVMPGMDGLQLLEQKGGDPSIRDIPVIVVSSKDPNADPVASDTLTVVHGGGMLMGDLIACIQAVSQVLAPGARSADPAPPETPVA
jgi:CheY-like chemotaxis protein